LKKQRLFLFFGVALFLLFAAQVYALEQKVSDLSASVEILPVFSLSLDNPNIVFGLMSPGETKLLGEGKFFNEIRCRSNSGRDWYLKAQIVSLKLLEREGAIPNANLKWKVSEYVGAAEPGGKNEFKAFSDQAELIYASQGDDNRGKEVILRLQYSLTSPLDASAGNYAGQIIFTLTESP
jgi:hypothetical protein